MQEKVGITSREKDLWPTMSLGLAELHAGKKRKKGNNISNEE